MIRDISNITRDLEDRSNNEIIWKKQKILDMFNADPDLLEVLGAKTKKPLNKYADETNPTDEELELRRSIEEYNSRIAREHIIPYMKLNGIQTDVTNYILFDIQDADVSYVNDVIKNQYLTIMCCVQEDDMMTEYGIVRTDLLAYIVRDLFNWTNDLGMHLKLDNDFPDILDKKYYCRTLKFKIQAPNLSNGKKVNRYDNF